MKSTREAYGDTLARLGEEHHFYVVDADLAKATQTVRFAKKFPDRFFNMGIAEANMMGFAAGLSTMGVPVFASSFAAFATGRAYDQVRNTLAYSKCNVKVCATHSGILVGPDGGSHQCIEDIALMRVIPNMVVICPCDYRSTESYVEEILKMQEPVYLRLGRSPTPEVYENGGSFQIGKGNLVKQGSDVTLFAIGDMVSKSINAINELEKENISVRLVDLASIKPMDEELVISCAKETGCVVTAEDHNIMGGMGSAVSEVLAKHAPTPMEMVGVSDVFGVSGALPILCEKFGIDETAIIAAVKKAVARKK